MTGFSAVRARPHEEAVARICCEFEQRGYSVVQLATDGHRPDLQFASDGNYVDVKVSPTPCLSVEIDSVNAYRAIEVGEARRVYIVHRHPNGWFVDTLDSLMARIISGPRRQSGAGSPDDWYLFKPGGSPLGEFFPPLA